MHFINVVLDVPPALVRIRQFLAGVDAIEKVVQDTGLSTFGLEVDAHLSFNTDVEVAAEEESSVL